MYQMKAEYYLGLEQIDEQHRKLFEMADKTRGLLKDENILYKCADIRKIIAGIKKCSLEHFQAEESYMEENGYEDIERHKKLHEGFIGQLTRFDEHVSKLSLKTQDDMLLELLDYLVEWLEKHILEEDSKYVK